MAVPFLDLGRQYARIGGDVRARMDDVIDKQAFILGERVNAIERRAANYRGADRAVGVSSGTDAVL